MKKAEREKQIRERAFELAETGIYTSWFEIGSALEKKGDSGAISALADMGLQGPLNETCRIAQSTEETERRENFPEWIKELLDSVTKLTSQQIPGLRVNATHPDRISFSTEGWELTVTREFNSSKLRVEPFGEVLPQELPDFEKVDGHKLAQIVIKAYKQKHS